ncbi:hypothetical protein ACFLYW_03265 [Thermodesulfobacteriota bacterium]
MESKKKFIHAVGVAVVGFCLIFSTGCSKNKEEQTAEKEEKGRIDQMTDEAADKAVRKIRTPIDKARTTQDFGDDRLESMDKLLQQQ